MLKMNRYRFRIPGVDGRPMQFPPEGPFWITGYGEDYVTVVAFSPNIETLVSVGRWPDAEDIDEMDTQVEINFTGRFPKPDWWVEEVA